MGNFQVTTTAFQVPWLEVKRKRDGKSHWAPVIPGPLFIHYESTEITYGVIFSQLNLLLRTKKVPANVKFAITTDGEIAMVKGCKLACPNCIHSLCHRHLRANVKRNLKGNMPEESVEILGQMFDKDDALVTIDDEEKFLEATYEIDTKAFKSESYFEGMVEKIWRSVIVPRKESNGIIKVKNNTNNVGKLLYFLLS